MRIAIPLSNGQLAMHFGHCEQFALVDVDETTGQHRGTAVLAAPSHEPGLLPRWPHDQSVQVIIADGTGQRAQQLFAEEGIRVVYGVAFDTPGTVTNAFSDGPLVSCKNLCDH